MTIRFYTTIAVCYTCMMFCLKVTEVECFYIETWGYLGLALTHEFKVAEFHATCCEIKLSHHNRTFLQKRRCHLRKTVAVACTRFMASEQFPKCRQIFVVCVESHDYFLGATVKRCHRVDYLLLQDVSDYLNCYNKFSLLMKCSIPMTSTCNFQLEVSWEIGFWFW